MATVYVRIGSSEDMYAYDDADYDAAIETTAVIRSGGAPVGATDVVRLSDLTALGVGDVLGPGSSTDNAIARFSGTTGKLIQNSTGAGITDGGVLLITGIITGDVLLGGGIIIKTVRIDNTDSPYTVLADDNTIYCDTDGGDIEIDLPAGVSGRVYSWVNVGSSGNTLTVDPNGSETIFGGGAGVAASFADGEGGSATYNSTEGWW